MVEHCINCDSKITDGGIFGSPNQAYGPIKVRIANFINSTSYEGLCENCGKQIVDEAVGKIQNEAGACRSYIKDNIIDFPMLTINQAPPNADCKIKAMVTANVSVGTGLFNEFGQGFSDLFGVTNTNSGMALKVNSGEATARSIIANKAIAMGANCVIAVDIDYGTTNNNAATVNMQGTAVRIVNLKDILDAPEFEKAQKIEAACARLKQLSLWLKGDFDSLDDQTHT